MDDWVGGSMLVAAVWDGRTERCRACSVELLTRLGGVCHGCGSVHCPFCGAASQFWQDGGFDLHEDVCEHLIASYSAGAGDWDYSPFAELAPPLLPTSGRPRSWREADKAAALGPLRPLLEAYEQSGWYGLDGELAECADEAVLFDRLFDLLPVRRRLTFWCPRRLGPAASGGTDYFVEEPARAEQELRALMDRLRLGTWRLAGRRSSRPLGLRDERRGA